jgi:hypothetical protein
MPVKSTDFKIKKWNGQNTASGLYIPAVKKNKLDLGKYFPGLPSVLIC